MWNTHAQDGNQTSAQSTDNNNSETDQKKGRTGYVDACGHSLVCAHFNKNGVHHSTPYRDCKCDKQNKDKDDTHQTRSN